MNSTQKKYPPPHEFWQRMTEWPADRAGHVFLANAVREIGEAVYHEAWQGFECIAGFNDVEFPKPVGYMTQALSDDEVARTKLLIGARERFGHVKKMLGSALADRRISFALRHVDGGEFFPQRETDPRSSRFGSEIWNIDNFECRFDYCQVDLANPFSGANRGDYFIFVEQSSLSEFVASLGSRSASTDTEKVEDVYLSPYLRFMIDFVASRGATPSEQSANLNSKKAVIEELLLSEWARRYPERKKLGESAVRYMGTFLREIESSLGKNRPS